MLQLIRSGRGSLLRVARKKLIIPVGAAALASLRIIALKFFDGFSAARLKSLVHVWVQLRKYKQT